MKKIIIAALALVCALPAHAQTERPACTLKLKELSQQEVEYGELVMKYAQEARAAGYSDLLPWQLGTLRNMDLLSRERWNSFRQQCPKGSYIN